ncbi:hypothetical protein [Chitinibacter sp. GC72]|uniref:hypothetical protein n=1 Tax=Chitinibacter sp. GC72 TaxID=1526917 RepID=UPI0012F9E5E3|nr:hypothetical protein [Chitinibacter sp. GC72]
MNGKLIIGCMAILMLGMSMTLRAEYVETFTPRHQLATQLAAALQDAFPAAAVRSFSGQIIVTAPDEASYRKIRALAAQLDQPVRSLTITVEQRSLAERQVQALDAQGRVVIGAQGSEARLDLGLEQQQGRSTAVSQQTLRTLDGGTAMIMLGQQRFVPQLSFIHRPAYQIRQYGGVWQVAGSGYYVAPALLGDQRISLKIAPQASSLQRDGRVNVHEVYSEVEGRLGEWLPIGETQAESSSDRRRLAGVDQRASLTRYSVWVKVELAQ